MNSDWFGNLHGKLTPYVQVLDQILVIGHSTKFVKGLDWQLVAHACPTNVRKIDAQHKCLHCVKHYAEKNRTDVRTLDFVSTDRRQKDRGFNSFNLL
jgi:hypothetical protein